MKVLNFGSLNIDYVYSVDHIVTKGETQSSFSRNVFSGGKGLNQSIALARADVAVYQAGMIGQDGLFLLDILKKEGVNVDFVQICDGASGHAIIQNSLDGENSILLYGGANQQMTKEYVDYVLSHFEIGDFLILQNEINELAYMIQKAHERGMVICLNPSPMNDIILQLPLELIDWWFFNEVEASQILNETTDVNKLVAGLKKKFPLAKVVLTLGEQGSVYIDQTQERWQKARVVKAVDTTAAGDTFTGYFLSAIFHQCTIEQALQQASDASAITVTRHGAAPSIPTMKELLTFVK